MSDDISVRVEKVGRHFGSLKVLQGADLVVRKGELVALYGPSGSGKTTLLNLVGALDYPTSGQIEVLGHNIVRMRTRRRARLRRQHIGFIFQSSTLLPTYTAKENIDLALRLLGLGYFERQRRIKAALQAVGLSAWADHIPAELSGGQQQRVTIARALAMRPSLILADEPTSGLDTTNTRRMMQLFQGIAASQTTTFLIVSHNPVIVDYVDHAYDLQDGKLTLRGNHHD